MSRRADLLDATLWLTLSLAVLALVPIGFVSNDGLGHSREFGVGSWSLNPNHLLFEPSGALWQKLWARLDPGRPAVDALKFLSGLAGALAVALFRLRIAPFVTDRRWPANYGTAWVAFSSAFLRLWVSDEIHMIQMPFVMLFVAAALRLSAGPRFRDALAAGIVTGLAALCFVSNLLLGLSLGVLLLFAGRELRDRKTSRRAAAGLAVAAVSMLAPAYTLAALHPRGGARTGDALSWVSHGRFGGSSPLARGESGYGLELTPRGVALAALRPLYGGASAAVDLSRFAAAVRDRTRPSPAAIAGTLLSCAAAAGALWSLRRCLRAPAAGALRVAGETVCVVSAPVLLFGFLWSNSDDQFYLALAPLLGLLGSVAVDGVSPRQRGLALAIGGAALAWNLADITGTRVLYPRADRVAQLEAATAGACLVVFPGFDEAELAFELSSTRLTLDHLSIAALAKKLPPAAGLRQLDERVEACMRRGGRVTLVDLFDVAPERNPWRYLARLGYPKAEVLRTLQVRAAAVATVHHGPFAVRILG